MGERNELGGSGVFADEHVVKDIGYSGGYLLIVANEGQTEPEFTLGEPCCCLNFLYS